MTSVGTILLAAAELASPGDLFAEESDDLLTLALGLFAIGVAIVEVVVYIATVVFFLMWVYRSRENLTAFGLEKRQLQYSTGWAVGSFFVPFVNLVVPYRAMKELWQKSVPNTSSMFSALSPPGLFPIWWAAWLLSNFADRIYFRLSFREEISADTTAIVGLISGVLGVVSAILALMVVKEIERQQSESSKLMLGGSEFPKPPAPPNFMTPGPGTMPASGYNSQ